MPLRTELEELKVSFPGGVSVKHLKIKKIPKKSGLESEPTTGLEPVTSSLPRKHSTAELSRQQSKKSH